MLVVLCEEQNISVYRVNCHSLAVLNVIGILDADALNISGPDRNAVPMPAVGHSGLLELVYSLGGPEL